MADSTPFYRRWYNRFRNWINDKICLHKHPRDFILVRSLGFIGNVEGIMKCQIDGKLSYRKRGYYAGYFVSEDYLIGEDEIPTGQWLNPDDEKVMIE